MLPGRADGPAVDRGWTCVGAPATPRGRRCWSHQARRTERHHLSQPPGRGGPPPPPPPLTSAPPCACARTVAGRELRFLDEVFGAIGDVVGDVVEGVATGMGAAAEAAGDVVGSVVGGELGAAIETAGDYAAVGGENIGETLDEIITVGASALGSALYNGRKCYWNIAQGMLRGSRLGAVGTAVGGIVGVVTNLDECADAFKYCVDAAGTIMDATVAAVEDVTCPASATFVHSAEVSLSALMCRRPRAAAHDAPC